MTHSASSPSQTKANKIKEDFTDKFFALDLANPHRLEVIKQNKPEFRNNASLITHALKAKIDSIN